LIIQRLSQAPELSTATKGGMGNEGWTGRMGCPVLPFPPVLPFLPVPAAYGWRGSGTSDPDVPQTLVSGDPSVDFMIVHCPVDGR
jgi:hypothetical protein